ncbi:MULTISPECIES: LLM class flavin-dependent oxidoreductase [Streptomyces]|uniref:LLM class flavin-dependent oxidoreductase n=1 Tax=Streptomyces lycopersici TaxID=2974589 RepID=UPI0021D2D9A0|nr:LLM class flavin-dependent oxidoreductase [Streptomyces sp. NEAU-383]
MGDRTFRFGLTVGPGGSAEEWAALARRAEDLGFSTLLAPDAAGVQAGYGMASSVPYLAAAAAATERLRVGNFVLAAPSRTPGTIAWDAAALDQLSQGRFELGLGAGRPDAHVAARLLGWDWGTPGDRLRRLRESVAEVRRIFGEALAGNQELVAFKPVQKPGPPILVAGGGDRLLTFAAQNADIIAFHQGSEDELADRVRVVREAASDRFDDIELSYNIWVIGDVEIPAWFSQFGLDPEAAKDNRSLGVLNGDAATGIDVLKRRRDELGVSYITINSFALDAAGPIVEALAGT